MNPVSLVVLTALVGGASLSTSTVGLTTHMAVVARIVERDPPTEEVVRRALEHGRLDEASLGSVGAGIAARAALPALEVSGGYSQTRLDESTILDEYSATSPWVLRGAGGNAAEVRVKLSWDLGRIAYSTDQLDVIGLRIRQEELAGRVARLIAARRRALLQLETADAQSARVEARLMADETTAILSAMTGGWFAQAVEPATP